MSSDVVYTAIRSWLEPQLTALSMPNAWENEHFTTPEPPALWVMVEVTGNFYASASIGAGSAAANLWREEGLVWVHVFVPMGSGSTAARTTAKTIADMFRTAGQINTADGQPIRFRDASIGRGQPGDEDGNYWALSLSVDWQADS